MIPGTFWSYLVCRLTKTYVSEVLMPGTGTITSGHRLLNTAVFILPGEYPAAMQTGSAGLSNSSISMATLVLLNLLYSRQLNGMWLLLFARWASSPTTAEQPFSPYTEYRRYHLWKAPYLLTGERRAAMQTGSAILSNSSLNVMAHIVMYLVYSVVLDHVQLNDGRLRGR